MPPGGLPKAASDPKDSAMPMMTNLFGQTHPERDPREIVCGTLYSEFHRLNDLRSVGSTRWTLTDLRSGARYVLASGNERSVYLELSLNPTLLDIRVSYPAFDEVRVWSDIAKGKDLSKRRFQTLDIVVTLPPSPCSSAFRYAAVFVKPKKKWSELAVRRRARREQDFCGRWNWSWYAADLPSKVAAQNYWRIYNWAKHFPLHEHSQEVEAFASALTCTESKKALLPLCTMLCRRLGLFPERALFYFAAGIHLGLIQVDFESCISEWEVIPLRRKG